MIASVPRASCSTQAPVTARFIRAAFSTLIRKAAPVLGALLIALGGTALPAQSDRPVPAGASGEAKAPGAAKAPGVPRTSAASREAAAVRVPDPYVGQLPAIALSHCAARLKAAFRSGNARDLQAAIQDVELLRRTYGTMDVLPLVEAMALVARDLGSHGDPVQGLKVLDAVERWAPRNPTLLATRVILLRHQGPKGYLLSLADTMELTRYRLTNPLDRGLWAVQHLAWLRLGITLLLWGWTLALALRYRKVFRCPLEEPLLRKGQNPHVVAIFGAIVVTLPVLAGLDPSFTAMLWLWLLAPTLQGAEVKASVLILMLQVVQPALTLVEPMASSVPIPSIVTLQQRPQALPVDAATLLKLAPADRAFLAGWRQLEFQEWAKAEATFDALAKHHPDQAEVLNNLGVARYEQGKVQGAQACFDEAATLAPGRGEILLNQSVIAYRLMDGNLGASKQEDARRLAPDVFNNILAVNLVRSDQRAFPLPLPDNPERIKALEPPPDAVEGPRGNLRDLVLLLNFGLPVLAAAAFLIRLRHSIGEAHPSQCTRCGDPFHTTDSPDPAVCSKCHHLFVLKDGLHAESRKRKVDEVGAFQASQRWLHNALTLLLPGLDKIFMGETTAGFVEFVLFCLAGAMILSTGRAVRYPGEIVQDPASVWMPMGILLTVLIYLRSWVKFLPRRG